MKTFKKRVEAKNIKTDLKKSKQSKLTLEIAEVLIEVKQMQRGLIQGLSLKDI